MQGRNDSVDSPDGKKGLFEDFSFSTVIASGLAAATSFALASQIGIAGSIIGTLIGGFASAAASQVYRSLLSASADKLRQVGPAGGEATATGGHDDSAPPRDADATVAASADPTRTIFRRPAVGLGAVEEVAESGTPIAPRRPAPRHGPPSTGANAGAPPPPPPPSPSRRCSPLRW